MDLHRSLFTRRVDEAEYSACSFVEPILAVMHAVFVLRLKVRLVGTFDSIGCQTVHMLVNVHVERHRVCSSLLSTANSRLLAGIIQPSQYQSEMTTWQSISISFDIKQFKGV